MSKSKRKTPIIITVIVLLLAAGYFLIPEVRYRLYPFNRIKGNITVISDGNICHLDEDNFRFPKKGDRSFYGFKGRGKVRIKNDTAKISFRGGKYGGYAVDIVGITDDKPITVCFYQYNWWNVQRFDMTVTVDTASGEVDFEADDVIAGNKDHYSITRNYKKEDCRINIGL